MLEYVECHRMSSDVPSPSRLSFVLLCYVVLLFGGISGCIIVLSDIKVGLLCSLCCVLRFGLRFLLHYPWTLR